MSDAPAKKKVSGLTKTMKVNKLIFIEISLLHLIYHFLYLIFKSVLLSLIMSFGPSGTIFRNVHFGFLG